MSSIHLQTAVPGPKSREIFAARAKAVSNGPFHITPVVAAEASGSVITDVDGNRLLDFAAGIGVANLGHCEPSVVAAVRAQTEKFLHTSINVVAYEGYVRVAERLNARMPGPGPHKTYLANSGAEAVENAVKFARAYTGRQAVIAFTNGYHGRTYMALALTAKAHPYKSGFAPFPAEVYRAPFPDFYRWPGTGEVAAECPGDRAAAAACGLARCLCREAFEAFAEVARVEIGERNVAAVVIEPVTGEGGFIPAPPPYLGMLRRWCDEHGVVLIFDEVQTGFGRTGTLFACEQTGVAPDLLALAKGLGNGLPISAVTGRAEILDAVGTGGVGGTYCGNPLACAAALAVMDRFDDPATLAHARTLGDELRRRLADWYGRFPRIGQVRGLGPMRALELVVDRRTKEPDKPAAQALLKYCYEHGVVVLSCGTYGNALRFLPPLTTSVEQLHEGLDVVEAGLVSLG
jgi:4-aminobutyrate aminotransferase/(S)-3-amino-2-methylpropionate transaminase